MFKSVGAKRPEDWAGVPLQNIETNDKERVVFSEYHGHWVRGSSYMVRKGEWKLIYYIDAPNQLFNLKEDPDEINNIYKEKPKKVKELEKELRKICNPEVEYKRAKEFQEKQMEIIEEDNY